MPTLPRSPPRPPASRAAPSPPATRRRAVSAGIHQGEIARELGVSRQAVSSWHAAWKAGGPDALRSHGPSGPTPRLSDDQLNMIETALLQGAVANGFAGQLWTLSASRW